MLLTQTSYPLDESLNIDFNDRISSLNTSLIHQLELLPNTTSSIQQIFHLIPIIFRFLRKNLQSKQKLYHDYNNLSNTIQKVISICSQYLHDRRDHENELLFLKDKIYQIIGQIGSTQYYLEHYWMIIHSLEHETQRLQILLSNSQQLQINQYEFQALEDNRKIKLDQLIKENEKIKILIIKQKDLIKTMQTQIEIDIQNLQTFKSLLNNVKLEQKDLSNHLSQIEKQNSHLQTINEKMKNMENEYNERVKTTQVQHDLVKNQYNILTDTYEQTNQRLAAMQTNEINIKQEIENIKNQSTTEQTRTLICRDQLQSLRHQTHELALSKRYADHILESEKHTNFTLERKRLLFENAQIKSQDRLRHLTEQLTNIIKQNHTNEHIISANHISLQDQQYKTISIEMVLKKINHLNNNLEQILQENHFIGLNEQEKLHLIKQISFQKRKEFIIKIKRLHALSIDEHHLTNNTIRTSLEIVRLNNIFHQSNNAEKYFHQILRKKKTEIMKREKHRANLTRSLRDNDDKMSFLTKKNQLIENELRNKIDHFHSLDNKFLKQKHQRIILSNQKQFCIYTYRQKLQQFNRIIIESNQLEKLSSNEINHIITKNEENEELILNIVNIKQQIMNFRSKNKRQMDECLLLEEKIRLYEQLHYINEQQQQKCLFDKNQFSHCIKNLQKENNTLLNNLRNTQKQSMVTISSHHDRVRKKDHLFQINQVLCHRPVVVRHSPMRSHIQSELKDYSILINRLMNILNQCVQWREKLRWINQLYFTKIEQIHQQVRFLSPTNEMLLRYKINSEEKQCKAIKAERRLQSLEGKSDDQSMKLNFS